MPMTRKRPPVRTAGKTGASKRLKKETSVAARKATLAKTCVDPLDTPLVADVGDTVAVDAIKAKAADKKVTKHRRGPSGVKRSAVDRLDDPPPAAGAILLDRVASAIECELTQIERIVGGNRRITKTQRDEADRRARTLALLSRTLGEVMRLRGMKRSGPEHDAVGAAGQIDAFRLDLAQRLDRLVAEAKALHPREDR